MPCEYFNISWIFKNIVGRKPSPISLWHFVVTEPERLFAEGLIKTNNRTLIYIVTSAKYTVQRAKSDTCFLTEKQESHSTAEI
jgi:hypothetical protein